LESHVPLPKSKKRKKKCHHLLIVAKAEDNLLIMFPGNATENQSSKKAKKN